MKRLLAISIASASIAIGAIPAVAEVDAKTHKLCLEAKDYLGCVKAMKGEITSGASNSRSNAKARTKEFKDKLYEFNKRQYVVENPHLAEWVSANPAAARKVINKKLRFFTTKDLVKLKKEREAKMFRYDSRLCIKRGKSIDSQFHWIYACSHDQSYGEDLDKKNELIYDLILKELARQEVLAQKEGDCTNKGKKIRLTSSGEVCMSDYEYAAFEQRERENEATERFRLQLESDREAERRRRALQDGLEGLRRITDSFNQNQPVNCFGSATTFGSTTFGNSTCY